MSEENESGEVRLFKQIIEAQKEEVSLQLSSSKELIEVIEVVDSAADFAKVLRDKHVAPNSPKIACKDKCHWCCHQSVGVSVPEVFRITEHIKKCKEKEKLEHLKRLTELNNKTKGKSRSQRSRINLPCAFLSFGRCRIYQVRPLLCQRQTSYDKEACKKAQPKGFPEGSIVSEKAQLLTHNGVIAGLIEGLNQEFKVPHKSLDLTAAALFALENENAFDRWVSGENVFSEAELNES
jgi:Fe-S-cluster containining protein